MYIYIIVIAILISDRADFRAKKSSGIEGQCQGMILREDVIIFNVYMSNYRVSKRVRQKLIKVQGEIDESTIIVGDFNTPLRERDISRR